MHVIRYFQKSDMEIGHRNCDGRPKAVLKRIPDLGHFHERSPKFFALDFGIQSST